MRKQILLLCFIAALAAEAAPPPALDAQGARALSTVESPQENVQ